MEYNDIRRSKYVELFDPKKFYSRTIYVLHDIKELSTHDNRTYYDALVSKNGQEFHIKLIHNFHSQKWYGDVNGSNLYELRKATNNIADVLCYGDNIVYKLPDRSYAIRVKVVRFIEKYRRFICEYNGERHNLSTFLARWSDDYIVGVYTYDERRHTQNN